MPLVLLPGNSGIGTDGGLRNANVSQLNNMEPLTVKDIQESLWRHFNTHMYHLYNSYVYRWECDYYSRSKSGKDYEVEIKLSRGDFFADFKKDKHRIFDSLMMPLANNTKLPHRFYYACPEGLIRINEIPHYAGLIEIRGYTAYEVKKAPILHKKDIDLTAVLLSKFYWETVEHRRNTRINNKIL